MRTMWGKRKDSPETRVHLKLFEEAGSPSRSEAPSHASTYMSTVTTGERAQEFYEVSNILLTRSESSK